MQSRNQIPQTVNSGSMADIAFLLLIFFLVTTTILQEKGLMLQLPPAQEEQTTVPVNQRNIFKIRINSNNQFLIQGEVQPDLNGLREEIKAFVVNNGKDPKLSESPAKAVISLKPNRGTDYKYFIAVLDEVKGAYYEIYGDRVGLSADEYRNLDHGNPVQYDIYLKGKSGIPMNISIAEPDGESS